MVWIEAYEFHVRIVLDESDCLFFVHAPRHVGEDPSTRFITDILRGRFVVKDTVIESYNLVCSINLYTLIHYLTVPNDRDRTGY
jgi:hypothetical protein